MPANRDYNADVRNIWDPSQFVWVSCKADKNLWDVGYFAMKNPTTKRFYLDEMEVENDGEFDVLFSGGEHVDTYNIPFGSYVRYIKLKPVVLFDYSKPNLKKPKGDLVDFNELTRVPIEDSRIVTYHGKAYHDDPRVLIRKSLSCGDDGQVDERARKKLWKNCQWNSTSTFDPPGELTSRVVVYVEHVNIAGGYLSAHSKNYIALRSFGLPKGVKGTWNLSTKDALHYRKSSTFWYTSFGCCFYVRKPKPKSKLHPDREDVDSLSFHGSADGPRHRRVHVAGVADVT